MKNTILKIFTPTLQEHWSADLVFALVRFVCGALLTLSFGSDKFGMPWSPSDAEFGLLEVAAWFPKDVAQYGGVFAIAPVLFAWLGAASEAIGGLFLALGLGTRISAFLIMCTMLVAIFFQKWGQGTWGMLPAMGFLWMSIYNLFLGSGRFGIDYLLTKRNSK
jgi:putative oxidoreductase